MKRKKEIENAIEWYKNKFAEFESRLNGEKEKFAHSIRRKGIERLEEVGFPTLKTEEWKYTNVIPLLKNSFVPITEKTGEGIELSEKFYHFNSYRIAFYNGFAEGNNTAENALPEGVIVESLKFAVENHSELVNKHLGKYLKINSGFEAINSAYLNDGIFVYLPKNVVLEKPLQILFFDDADGGLSNYRNLIVAEKNSSASVVFNSAGEEGKKYFVNTVNEIVVGENAALKLYTIQNESAASYHIEKSEAEVKDSGTFKYYSFPFGGGLVRNDISVELDGENINCHLYGLYPARKDQHIDNHTFINHAKPNSFSEELYKGILEDEAHGVFAGKILVSPDAQKTNAYQSNKTLLLSRTATIDTKPQLEIYADDVKCSHGATVGQLDKEQLFYILSRGIPFDAARSMLIKAFANDVLAKVEIGELKELLNAQMLRHFDGEK